MPECHRRKPKRVNGENESSSAHRCRPQLNRSIQAHFGEPADSLASSAASRFSNAMICACLAAGDPFAPCPFTPITFPAHVGTIPGGLCKLAQNYFHVA